jgi:hypothetical protein
VCFCVLCDSWGFVRVCVLCDSRALCVSVFVCCVKAGGFCVCLCIV